MPRRIVSEGELFKIEFDTAGGGSYYAVVRGAEKGPFVSQEMAARHVAAKLEGFLNSPDEITQAEDKAMQEADQREAEGTLGSDHQRVLEEQRRQEEEAELEEIRKEQELNRHRQQMAMVVSQYDLTEEEAEEALRMRALGADLTEAVNEIRSRTQAEEPAPGPAQNLGDIT